MNDPNTAKSTSVQPQELEALAAHVREEYEAVRIASAALIKLAIPSQAKSNLMRELFVTALNIHGRNLVFFFDSPIRKHHPEDVVARDFDSTWELTRGVIGGNVDWLKGFFLPGVHKRLAHISAHRVRVPSEDDAMQVVDIYMSIAALMQAFIDRLPPDRRRWFERSGELPNTTIDGLGM